LFLLAIYDKAHVLSARQTVPGFAIEWQARRIYLAESSSLSYGLVVRLPLLSTPSRDDAVTVGYRYVTFLWSGLAPLWLYTLAGAPFRFFRDQRHASRNPTGTTAKKTGIQIWPVVMDIQLLSPKWSERGLSLLETRSQVVLLSLPTSFRSG
jgi:hypothetical protein